MNRSPEDQKVANEMFDTFRDDLLKRDLSNTENYDKAVLTLSSAALGFSLTAVKSIVPIESSSYVWLLLFGWSLLVISVIFSLSAYLVSNKAIQVQLSNARDYYKNGVEEAFTRKSIFLSLNNLLNHAAGLLVAVAIALIVVFISININNGDVEMSKGKSSGTNIDKSVSIPTMEKVSNTHSDWAKNSANIPTMEQAPSSTTTSQGGSSSESKK